MVQTHSLEIQKEFADAVLCGDKTFEICRNDRGYQKGDLICFVVMNGMFSDICHELNKRTYKITYVSNVRGQYENYVVLAIREEKTDEQISSGPTSDDRTSTGHPYDGHIFDGQISSSRI